MGCVDNFRLMWFENSVKYRKPFSPQPTQFPEKPATTTKKKWLSFKTRQNKTKKNIFTVRSGPAQSSFIPVGAWNDADSYLSLSLLSRMMGTDWPKSAFFPFSSGRKRRSTAHTRMCSGTLGDLAPTSSKPAGTSMGSVAMETRRRSLPAWQKPEDRGERSIIFFSRRWKQQQCWSSFLWPQFSGMRLTVQCAAAIRWGGLQIGKWRAAAVWVIIVLQLLHVVGRVAVHELMARWLPAVQVIFGLYIWQQINIYYNK